MKQPSKALSEQSLTGHDRDRDSAALSLIERWVLQRVGGRDRLERYLPTIVRQAFEEVVDWPRTRREKIDELNRAERAYLGKKIEIVFKHWLGVVGGKTLEVYFDGIEAGVKSVFGADCSISNSRMGRPLLVIQTDLINSRVSLAALAPQSNRTSLATRRAASNNDEARSRRSIHWLCVDCEIKKSATFTQMMLMYRRRTEQERLQLRALVDFTYNEMAKRAN